MQPRLAWRPTLVSVAGTAGISFTRTSESSLHSWPLRKPPEKCDFTENMCPVSEVTKLMVVTHSGRRGLKLLSDFTSCLISPGSYPALDSLKSALRRAHTHDCPLLALSQIASSMLSQLQKTCCTWAGLQLSKRESQFLSRQGSPYMGVGHRHTVGLFLGDPPEQVSSLLLFIAPGAQTSDSPF